MRRGRIIWVAAVAALALAAGWLYLRLVPFREAAIVPETLYAAEVLEGLPDFSGCADTSPFLSYAEPDALGRAGAAFGVLSAELMTDEPRPELAQIHLPGMHNAQYDFIEDGWVYNRCHLIGHRFGGESITANLICGTHALNYTGMLAWEDQLGEWLRKTKRHAFYRVTPLYEGDELVCRSVRMDALACDGSWGFSVICPNVQPGVAIDYASGWTTLADDWSAGGTTAGARTYVVNSRTGRFHLPECAEAAGIGAINRQSRLCGREALLAEGLQPCGKCRP